MQFEETSQIEIDLESIQPLDGDVVQINLLG
jgi:hypothetical protein